MHIWFDYGCGGVGVVFVVVLVVFFFFFFKAEDGIRVLVRSRGLGEGYKRRLSENERATERMPTSASYGRQPDTNGLNRPVNYLPPLPGS